MTSIRCVLLGFGSVARAFLHILTKKEAHLKKQYGVRVLITGAVTENHGRFLTYPGLGPEEVMEEYRRAAGFTALPQFQGNALNLIKSSSADVAFEMTSLNHLSGQPAVDHVKAALQNGIHMISANKGPVACGLKAMKELSQQTGKAFLYETAVMDGAPVFNLVDKCLPGCTVTGFQGVLNSTTNFVLDQLMEGSDFSSALAIAREMGFAEADPAADIEGWDSACKTAALMNAWMDADVSPCEIPRQGIDHVNSDRVAEARERGMRLRLICRAAYRKDTPEGEVALVEVPVDSEMARVRGTTSLLRISTDLMGDISIVEHEPRIEQSGYGLFSDLVRLLEDNY